jgi:uncharacterized protein
MPAGALGRSRARLPERCFAQCTARFTGGEILRRATFPPMEQTIPLRLRGLEPVEALGVRVPVASDPGTRLLGLAFVRRRRAGPGLLIPRCRSVHTFGMLFDLDVHFIDAAGAEVRTARAVPPGRILCERRAVAVLEVPSEGGETAGPVT